MNTRVAAVRLLEAAIGHSFADRALLERALTHASVGHGARRTADNERLEFLGDRVLGLIIADTLTRRDDHASVGALSKRLAGLVSRPACARVARSIDLGAALRLPGGESQRGARDHETILADACEAVIAALYLELGLEAASERVLALWAPLLDETVDEAVANPKSALQEWAAAAGRTAPAYRLVSRTGPDHAPRFEVEVSVGGDARAAGVGGSLQAAQKDAALKLLRQQGQP